MLLGGINNRNWKEMLIIKLIRYDMVFPVKVRKYEVDISSLQELLRSSKKELKLSTKTISEALDIPKSEVDHWFRTDEYFSIPSDEIWMELKKTLHIETDAFDKSVMTFETKDGSYDQSNRVYDDRGLCPTLTTSSNEIKILITEDETTIKGEKKLREQHDYKLNTPLKILSLFSGIGAFEKALTNLEVDFELVGFSEIDKYAIQAYTTIHNVSDDLNLGDVSKVDTSTIPNFDLMTYGFPCQDISVAGKQVGFSEESNTRSSLLWEAMKIAKHKKPKYMIAENVRNLVSKKFKDDFDKWLVELDEMGYNTYVSILNARDFRIPQNRERVFVVSIRKDIDTEKFEFPVGGDEGIRLKDILEDVVDAKYFLSDEVQSRFKYNNVQNDSNNIIGSTKPEFRTIGQRDRVYGIDGHMASLVATDYKQPKQILIKNATTKGYLEAVDGDGVDLAYPDSNTRRGRVQPQRSHTLTTSSNLGVLDGIAIRKLTPLECYRLMGFSDYDFHKVKSAGISDTQLYRTAGNSIVVNVVESLLHNLLKDN